MKIRLLILAFLALALPASAQTRAVTVNASGALVTPSASTFKSANGLNSTTLTITNSTGTLTIGDGKTVTIPASLTLDGTDGKTLTVSNSITLAGTDSTTMTFPTTSASIARTDAGQTFTGDQVFTKSGSDNTFLIESSQAVLQLLRRGTSSANCFTQFKSDTTVQWSVGMATNETDLSFINDGNSGALGLKIIAGGVPITQVRKLRISDIPTSSSGLSSGDVWRDTGDDSLHIVP